VNVAIIPAKGVSRRIPNKNIRPFMGRPILSYSIQTAKDSRLFDSIIVSTDSEEVSEVAQRYGADVLIRGEKWSREEIGPIDVARHSLSFIADATLVGIIYATAPLLSVYDLVAGYKEVHRAGTAFSISIGAGPFFHDAAQFIFAHAWALREGAPEIAPHTAIVPIPPERDCDINEEADWLRAERMYAALQERRLCA